MIIIIVTIYLHSMNRKNIEVITPCGMGGQIVTYPKMTYEFFVMIQS